MTEPPYNTDIRSDTPSGLRGLFTALSGIAAGLSSLPAILIQVTAINTLLQSNLPLLLTRITYLTGTNAPAPAFGNFGLPSYLGLVVGNRATASTEAITLWEWARSLDASGGSIVQAIGGNPTPDSLADNMFLRQYTELQAILNSLGVRGVSPTNLSALGYLALIANSTERSADCCEEGASGGGGGGGPAPTVPPTDLCSQVVQASQVQAWVPRGQAMVDGIVRDIFVPEFGPFPQAPFSTAATTEPGGTWSNIFVEDNYNANLTVSWDYSNVATEDVPIAFTLIEAINSQPDGGNWAQAEPVTTGNMVRGCSTYNVGECAFGPGDIVRYYVAFAFNVGVVPQETVWANSEDIGCAS